jgi:hypothetical protein
MNRERLTGAILILGTLLLSSCGSVTTRSAPSVRPSRINHVYIEHELSDGRNLDRLFAAELRRRGYDAASGPPTEMPDGEDAIISYQDTWTYDFTDYMIQLDISVRDARSGVEIATGHEFEPSFIGTKPEKMIAKVLDKIFKPHVPAVTKTLVEQD